MNTKYASKPNLNPNEPNLFGFANVILAKARIQISFSLISGLSSLVYSKKQTQFFYDQICIINIKNAERKAKKLDKKTKRTQLWITFYAAM